MKTIVLIGLFLTGINSVRAEEIMTPLRLQEIINEMAEEVVVEGNIMQFSFKGVQMYLIHDKNADRMRLVTPIIESKELQKGVLEKAMEANFHSALDARYATSSGVVWSVFIHPLSDLQESFFWSAVLQVVIARETFGEAYTSGAMLFGVERKEDVI